MMTIMRCNNPNDDHHHNNPVDTLGFGERREGQRENAAAAAETPPLLGAFCFYCGTALKLGQPCGETPGGQS